MGWTMNLVRAVSALVLAAGALVMGVAPCAACSCAYRPPAKILEDADAAFVGEVVGDRSVDGGTMQRFRVDEVYAGTLPPEVEVFAQIGANVVDSCAILYSGGHLEAVVLYEDDQGRFRASPCSMVSVAEMQRVGGEPRPPEAAAASASPAVGGTDGAESDTVVAGDALPGWQVALAGLAIGLVLIAFSMLVGRRRGSSDRASPIPDEISPPDPDLHAETED